jgi:anti-sigma factor RsiW
MTTAPDHHPDDELVDLALGHVTGERRTELARHLLACPPCRQSYEGLIASVEAVAAAAPAVQPPLGFDQRTLARMGVGGPSAPAAPVARPGWRWLPAVAAAVVALALVAGGGAWWVGRDDPGGPDRVAALTTGTGRDVGTATVTEVAGEPVLVVGLTVGEAGDTYTCRMRFADGSTLDTDPWSAAPGAGWLVRLPDDRGPLTGIELLAPDHGAWSAADLDE